MMGYKVFCQLVGASLVGARKNNSPRPRRAQRGQGERVQGEGEINGYHMLTGNISR